MHRQTNREMLDYSSIFGVTKFPLYHFGRHFTLPTDHKELTLITVPRMQISVTPSSWWNPEMGIGFGKVQV